LRNEQALERFSEVLSAIRLPKPLLIKFAGCEPKDRAEGCAEEFQQVAYAVKVLIDPSVDVELARKIKAAHKARWEGENKKATEAVASQPK
ncbi:MAG TPA: hypothetical protein VG496_03375, partial [Myxococcales bacterium]|nr:hypothetical protein [Myxococcales bacterium]